jgi:hypothetical protein
VFLTNQFGLLLNLMLEIWEGAEGADSVISEVGRATGTLTERRHSGA